MDGKQIRSVTTQGLAYVDEDGVEKFIDFSQCYENYLKFRLSPETWEKHKEWNNKTDTDWDEYVESTKKFRVVGDRNIMTPPWADGPFIEFYTEPRIRFKFESLEDWYEVRQAIERGRWRTIDLS